MSGTVFSDTFEVKAVNPEKKVFDRIDRLQAQADTYDCDLVIDVSFLPRSLLLLEMGARNKQDVPTFYFFLLK